MCDLWEDPEARAFFEARGWPEPVYSRCDDCSGKIHIGDWPICVGNFGSHKPQGQYRPFIGFWDKNVATSDKWDDPRKGVHVDSLAKWNRLMKEGGWELSDSKHDRQREHMRPNAVGFDSAFNKAVRDRFGGVLPVGSFLRDEE